MFPIFFAVESTMLGMIQDGDESSCLDYETLGHHFISENNKRNIALIKDLKANNIRFQVKYDRAIDCKAAIIFYQRLINSSCNNAVRESRLVHNKETNGIICYYQLPCKRDDVICSLELMLREKAMNLSVCEIV